MLYMFKILLICAKTPIQQRGISPVLCQATLFVNIILLSK